MQQQLTIGIKFYYRDLAAQALAKAYDISPLKAMMMLLTLASGSSDGSTTLLQPSNVKCDPASSRAPLL